VPQGKISEVNAFIVGANHEEKFSTRSSNTRNRKIRRGGIRRFYKSMTVRIRKTRRVYNDVGNASASQDLGVTILINSIRT